MQKNIKIDSENALLCPNCDQENLHHYRVEVSDRDTEDGKNVSFVTTMTGTAPKSDRPSGFSSGVSRIPNELARNPSVRGHGLRIIFWCEECGSKPELEIAQHKGLTLINWD